MAKKSSFICPSCGKDPLGFMASLNLTGLLLVATKCKHCQTLLVPTLGVKRLAVTCVILAVLTYYIYSPLSICFIVTFSLLPIICKKQFFTTKSD